jgi:hypothetical protein
VGFYSSKKKIAKNIFSNSHIFLPGVPSITGNIGSNLNVLAVECLCLFFLSYL